MAETRRTLTRADAEFAKFKVLVTKADGTTEVETLVQLNITEIDFGGDATHIELPDGPLITGQTIFARGDGTTVTVADATLVSETMGYRVEETVISTPPMLGSYGVISLVSTGLKL